MNPSRQAFDQLLHDYHFFELHTTEHQETLRVWRPWLQRVLPGPLRFLDFGAGTGGFTVEVLRALQWPAGNLEIDLVEPAGDALPLAVERCQPFSRRPVEAARQPKYLRPGEFGLIVSHHSLYYVPNLQETASELMGLLEKDGLLLAVVGSDRSGPGMIQEEARRITGQKSPYFSGDQVCKAFLEVAPQGRVTEFPSELRMRDTRAHRESVMRFVAGEYANRSNWERMLAILDRWSDHYEIVVPSVEYLLVIDGKR